MFVILLCDDRGNRPDMSLSLPLGSFIAHMSGADFFGLVVSVLVIAYLLLRADPRGEALDDVRRLADDRRCSWSILTALAMPLGSYMANVYTGERVLLTPIFGGPERFLYRILRVDPRARAGLEGLREEPDHLLARRLAVAVPDPAHAGRLLRPARAEPARLPLGAVERDVQHRLVVHDEHQLAVLQRRDDDELPQPDDRADGAELALGRRRHRRGGRARARDHLPQRQEPRQLLAGPGAHDPLRARADLVDRRDRARLPGRDRRTSPTT